MTWIVLFLALVSFCTAAQAACVCRCIDGVMQPLCSSALDIQPMCMGICGPTMPSIAPIMPPTLPPLGTSDCRLAQVCNMFGNCRWRQVCD
jgi:hypothetical protein